MATDFNLDDKIKAAINVAFEPAVEERFIAEDSQQINGVWYNPVWGCDTMQHFIDVLRDCDAEYVNDVLEGSVRNE